MAKKPKESAAAATKAKSLDRDQFMKLVSEADRQKETAAEYAANHATIVRNGLERLGLDKHAFGFARKISRMEPVRGQAAACEVIKYLGYVGAFDQADAFSPVTETLRALLADLDGRDAPPVPASAAVLDELAGQTVN